MKWVDRIFLSVLIVLAVVLLLILWREGILPALVFLFQFVLALGVLATTYQVLNTQGRTAMTSFASLCVLLFIYWVYRVGTFELWADGLAAFSAFIVSTRLGYRGAQLKSLQWTLSPGVSALV